MQIRLFSVFILLVALLVACDNQPTKPAYIPLNASLDDALASEQAGNYAQAAREYYNIGTKSKPPNRWQWLLHAVDNMLKSGAINAAQKVLSQIKPQGFPDFIYQKKLLIAEIELLHKRPKRMFSLLEALPLGKLSESSLQRYYRLQSDGHELAGNPIESARMRVVLDAMLTTPAQRLANQQAILTGLTSLTGTALHLLRPPQPNTLAGWMDFARLQKQYGSDPGAMQRRISAWRNTYPDHPIQQALLESFAGKVKTVQVTKIKRVALLLAGKGPWSLAGKTFLNGFMAAYYDQPSISRPEIDVFYTETASDTANHYAFAVAQGADFIIGPLDIDEVNYLIKNTDITLPTLALNRATGIESLPEHLYQFGLFSEDEAQLAAERAWLDGRSKAVILVPDGGWGERIADAFQARWQELGGTLLDRQHYSGKKNDFGPSIEKLFNLDQSKYRFKRLKYIVQDKLQFEPRRRQDVDAIFLAALPRQARLLRPQLQFHLEGNIPIYSTSHVFTGQPLPDNDRDLEGLIFCDMPWLLSDDIGVGLSKEKMTALWPETKARYLRFFAMGMDAYSILPHIQRLQSDISTTFDGRSGNLYLDDKRQLRRQLVWAHFRNGIPQVKGYAPRMDMDMDMKFASDPENQPPPESELKLELDNPAI